LKAKDPPQFGFPAVMPGAEYGLGDLFVAQEPSGCMLLMNALGSILIALPAGQPPPPYMELNPCTSCAYLGLFDALY